MTVSRDDIIGSQGLIIDTFRSFRDQILSVYGRVDYNSKSDGSPVTELDIRIERAVKDALADKYPDFGFQGEESGRSEGVIDARWVVDPIDGTQSFVHGLPYMTNMAGFVIDGQTVASVIYNVAEDALYTAIRGEGAYRNGQRLHVNNRPIEDSLVYTHSFAFINLRSMLMPDSKNMYVPVGASGHDYTLLASGSIQGVFRLNSNSQVHDNIPGVLLVEEAGAVIISFEADTYTPETRSFVVATPKLAEFINDRRTDAIKVLKKR